MTPEPGIYYGVDLREYRAWEAFGSSDLKAMRIGPPALVPWRKAHPEEETDATRIGSAAHCAILEHDAFERRFAHKPEGMTFASKDGKAWRDDPCRAGMTILTHDEWELVEEIRSAFWSKSVAAESLKRATAREASLVWTDEDTGLELKGRPDWYTAGEYVTDLKISRHGNLQTLAFRAYTEGWIAQLAHYRAGLISNGVPIKGGRIVVVNPEPPQQFRVFCVEAKQDALSLMHLENERIYKQLAECKASGVWRGAPDEWVKIDLPPLALQEAAAVAWDEEQAEIRHG